MSSPGESFPNDWISYWNREDLISDKFWALYRRHFVRASSPYMNYNADDHLLDIGCGAGHIDEELSPAVKEVVGIDTAPRLIAECQRRLRGIANASFAVLPAQRPFDFEFLAPRKFEKIICVSVVQYYREPADLARLIAAVRGVAAPGARFLVSDIIVEGSLLSDTIGSILGGVRSGCVVEKLKFLMRAATSEYISQRRRHKLLSFSRQDLDQALRDFGVPGTLVRAQLTLNSSRRHILYQF